MTDDAVTDTTDAPAPRRGQQVRANRDRSFDAALGVRVRALRVAAGMSQTALGQAIGVSFQQLQKYELGKDRLSASTLYAIANALRVPPGTLFEDGPHVPTVSSAEGGVAVKAAVVFQQIHDRGIRKRLVDLAKVLGAGGEGEGA